ncbi:MAG: guanylate kinase [Aquificaceae bacterium]|nr:guanylate kinase [Aquificaceae bacterium]MCS7197040.1 guanylate kinase [Aquificaceae bacterium]MCX7990304.1 guanylate kinase [Aquificaceae bacterium]MDW8295148.1 guanylate kinase [Aquificaceae bacterium]
MLFVLSAPSGTGKTTVVDRLFRNRPDIRKIVTATTRPKREGEVQGVDYIFLTPEEFEIRIREGYFLEYAKVYGSYYGTPKEQVIRNEEEGVDSLLVIDVQGAKRLKESYKDCLLLFLMPPSFEELRRRLINRGYGKENLEERLKKAREEIACARYFDYIVVNDFIDKAVEALQTIISAQKYRKEKFLKKPSIKDEKVLESFHKDSCEVFEK